MLEAGDQAGRALDVVLEGDGQLFAGHAGLQRLRVEVGGDTDVRGAFLIDYLGFLAVQASMGNCISAANLFEEGVWSVGVISLRKRYIHNWLFLE